MAPMSMRSAWLIGGAAVLLAAGTVVALTAMVPSGGSSAQEQVVIFAPSGPSEQGPNDSGHKLIQVGDDLVANPPDYELTVRADDSVHSATLLASGGGLYAYGMLSTGDQIYMTIVNPAKGEATGQVVAYDAFETNGLTVASGSVRVTWRANGDVTWEE